MRIATWNCNSIRSRVDRAVALLERHDLDVLALQEVDRDQPRSGYLDLAGVAAEAMGATEHRFLAAMTGTPGRWRPARPGDGSGPAYGIALLSRLPVDAWREVLLPGLPLPVPYRWPGARRPSLVRDEQRAALVATVLPA